MNISALAYNQSSSALFLEYSKRINFFACFLLIILGVVGNVVTSLLLTTKSKFVSTSKQIYLRTKSLSSPQVYMLGLAISDLIFLLAHFFEDTFPSMSANGFFQIINTNKLFCKLVLYMRNASRFSSSYLVVLFAWERYVIISSPLKRLNWLSVKKTKSIVCWVFACSLLLTSYTLFISGLRAIEAYEMINSVPRFECDTLAEFKEVYDYIIGAYTSCSILIPIALIFFFNMSIIYKLHTRKNTIFKQSFPLVKLANTNSVENKALNAKLYLKKVNGEHSNISLLNQHNRTRHLTKQAKLKCPSSSTYKMTKSSAVENSMSNNVTNMSYTVKVTTKEDSFSIKGVHRISGNTCKNTDKVNYILILISSVFMALNLPYIISWLCFYIPFKQGRIDDDQIFFRYSFVTLAEILNMVNFSINFLFYFISIKSFKKKLYQNK